MEEGSADAYTWDAPSHVIESVDDFALDPRDNADQWFGMTLIFVLYINITLNIQVHNKSYYLNAQVTCSNAQLSLFCY